MDEQAYELVSAKMKPIKWTLRVLIDSPAGALFLNVGRDTIVNYWLGNE